MGDQDPGNEGKKDRRENEVYKYSAGRDEIFSLHDPFIKRKLEPLVNKTQMKALLNKIADQKVFVVGDIVLDHYIWGDAERISPEAPVPVVAVEDDSYMAGMGANVAINVKSLGGQAELLGWVGDDEAGNQVASMLEQAGVQFDSFWKKKGLATLLKTRVMARRQQLCRLDREGNPDLYGLEDTESLQYLENELKTAKAVIVSDYAKGVVSEGLIHRLLELKQDHDFILAVDPKPSRRLAFKGVDLMTPNRLEALQLADVQQRAHEDFPAEAVCQAIWERHQPKFLVITLGPKGMLLSHEGKVSGIIPTYAREVFDVSGAGDTVVAALTLALAAGADLKEAAHFANSAAGVVVGKLGTATASIDEVLHFESSLA